jgi:hypothetical protein
VEQSFKGSRWDEAQPYYMMNHLQFRSQSVFTGQASQEAAFTQALNSKMPEQNHSHQVTVTVRMFRTHSLLGSG